MTSYLKEQFGLEGRGSEQGSGGISGSVPAMRVFTQLHNWNVSVAEAIALQEQLRSRVVREDVLPPVIARVAGIDIGFEDGGRLTRAAVVVLAFPSLELRECRIATIPTTFPYVPGLLSFREVPAALRAMEQVEQLPDVILCDGQGLAHPRRLGLASHLGLALDIPTIGAAKSRLIGTHRPLPAPKGRSVPLMDGDEQIGIVLRTRSGVKPMFVSIGHKVTLSTARDLVLQCVTRYRLPETTRLAHRLCSG
jgi:deoxyribonuclease V